MGELWMVQVRACTPRAESRSHEDERLPGEARLAHPVGELRERTLYDQLVRPARLVDDSARCIGGVATLQKLLLQQTRAGGGEEDRHRGAVSGEALYVLALRHRGAAGAARQDDALGDLRHREL